MYNWTRELRKEAKIIEAYDMLKKQGIVKSDPLTHDQVSRSSSIFPYRSIL